jgi:hypothetical protein
MLSVLLLMAGGVRREWLNTAVGYPEGVIPFDRALNAWKSERAFKQAAAEARSFETSPA